MGAILSSMMSLYPSHVRAKMLLLLAACLIVGGCVSDERGARAPDPIARQQLSEGYTLLHMLLRKESDADKILFLKGGPDSFKQTIKDIARTSREGAKQIAEFAAADPAISLAGAGLPEVESHARDSIEAKTTRELLGAGGRKFVVRMTVEQLKAMRYATYLARTVADRDPDAERAHYLMQLADEFAELNDRLLDQLVHPPQEN